MTSSAPAGVALHASALLLPAATTLGTPELCRAFAASSAAWFFPPPRLMFAVAGLSALFMTHSMPAMTPDQVPPPLQPKTLTATTLAFFATPYSFPATVPATWVPWPLQSSSLPSPVKFSPHSARFPSANSSWVMRIPVSRM